MTVIEFAKGLGYSEVRDRGEWRGFKVYQLVSDVIIRDEERMRREREATGMPAVPGFLGLPVFAIEKDGVFRTATPSERDEIMGWSYK